jgi:hypothetical protein
MQIWVMTIFCIEYTGLINILWQMHLNVINPISLKVITHMFHSERRTSFSLFTLCHSVLICKFSQIHVLFSDKEEKIGIQNMLTELEEKYL